MNELDIDLTLREYANNYTDKGLIVNAILPKVNNIESIKTLKYCIYHDSDRDGEVTNGSDTNIWEYTYTMQAEDYNRERLVANINIFPDEFEKAPYFNDDKDRGSGEPKVNANFEYGEPYILVITAHNENDDKRGHGESNFKITPQIPTDILINMSRAYVGEKYGIKIDFNLTDNNKVFIPEKKQFYYGVDENGNDIIDDKEWERIEVSNEQPNTSLMSFFKEYESDNPLYKRAHAFKIQTIADINNIGSYQDDSIPEGYQEKIYSKILSEVQNYGFGYEIAVSVDKVNKKVKITPKGADYLTIKSVDTIKCSLYDEKGDYIGNIEQAGVRLNEESGRYYYNINFGDYFILDDNKLVGSVLLKFYDRNGQEVTGKDILFRVDIKN